MNIVINSDSRYVVDKLVLQAAVVDVLKQNRIQGNVEIGISIIGDRKMHEINKQYRGLDSTTDILSFALEDPISTAQLQNIPYVGFVKAPDKLLRLGDILISYPQVIKDAAEEGVSVDEELILLVQHGTKHLLGIHHDQE